MSPSSLPADLKGKKIGLSSPGSLGDASVDAWLKEMGWTDKDVQKTFLKSSTAEVTALKQGAVDAIVTQPPTGTQTRDFGAVKIMDFTKYDAAANAYHVTGKYLEANKEAITRFVKSEVDCLAMLHKDKKKAVASIIKHTTNPDEALAEYSYDFFEPLWAKNPAIDPKLVDAAVRPRGSARRRHEAGGHLEVRRQLLRQGTGQVRLHRWPLQVSA